MVNEKHHQESELERCLRQIREQLAHPNPNNPRGLVVCKLEAREHVDLVAAELTRDELLRVRFQVKRR